MSEDRLHVLFLHELGQLIPMKIFKIVATTCQNL